VLSILNDEAERALLRLIDDRVDERLASKHGREQAPPLLTVAQTAKLLCTTPGAIYKRISRGQLACVHPDGSKKLIRRDHILDLQP
jgi:hypothetical protein